MMYLLRDVLRIEELCLRVHLRFEVLTELLDKSQPISIAKHNVFLTVHHELTVH